MTSVPFMPVGALFASPISRWVGSKKIVMIATLLVSGLTYVLMYFVSPVESPVIFFGLNILGSVFMGANTVMSYGMFPDTIEYGQYKTGIRADGFIYSFTLH